MKYVVSPGYTNSGADHWQSHLERSYQGFTRVEHSDWNYVNRQQWIAEVESTISATEWSVIFNCNKHDAESR